MCEKAFHVYILTLKLVPDWFVNRISFIFNDLYRE